MSYFERAQNFGIYGPLTQIETYNAGENKKCGFEMLLEHVVTSAYDDVESHDQLRCHPGTREQVQDEIIRWVNENNEKEKVQWVYGPAGAGKSAIARSVFDREDMEGIRCGFFAFKRGSGTRDKAGPLIPTLAYQLAVNIDRAKEYICRAIERDPRIFSYSIKKQMQKLIVEPLERCRQHAPKRSLCFIVDGLDECTDEKVQASIITSIVHSLSASQVHLKFLIFSRPEIEIRTTFRRYDISSYCSFIELNERFNPDRDIDIFLRDKFEDIKRSHAGMSPSLQWPAEWQIISIIGKSTGQFIYPATVVKYVENHRRNPMEQLNNVLKLHSIRGENPFSELDALYMFILRQCHAGYQNISNIFMILMFTHEEVQPTMEHVSKMTGESTGNIRITLTDLHSVVKVPDNLFDELSFHHASFGDFLKDKTRSSQYYIDNGDAHTYMAKKYIIYMDNISEDNKKLRDQTAEHFANHAMRSSDEYLKSVIEERGIESHYFSGFSFWDCKNTGWVLYAAIGNIVIILADYAWDRSDYFIDSDFIAANVDEPRRIFRDQDEVLLPFISYEDDFGVYHFGKENGCEYRISTLSTMLLEDLGTCEDAELGLTMCSANILETEDAREVIKFDVEKACNCQGSLEGENHAGYFKYFKHFVECFMRATHIHMPKQIYFHIFNTMLQKSEEAIKNEWGMDLSPFIEISQFIESEREVFIQAMKRRGFEPWRIERLQTRMDCLIQVWN